MTTERLFASCLAGLTLCSCVHTAPLSPKPQPEPQPTAAAEQPTTTTTLIEQGRVVPGRVHVELARSHWRREFEPAKEEQPPAGIERLVPDTGLVTVLRCLELERMWRTFAELERKSDSLVRVIEYDEWLKTRPAKPRRSNSREYSAPELPTASSRFELKFPDRADLTKAVETLRRTAGVVSAEVVTVPLPDFMPNDPGYLAASAPGYDATLARGRWGFHNTGAALGAAYLDNFDIDAPEAWDTQRGSPSVVVAVFDTVVDVAHPDLYLNVFLNNGEVPPAVVAAYSGRSTDDGLPAELTFYDLNVPSVITALAATDPTWTDRNGNGRIDGEDVVAWWSDGTDADGNGRVDDLIGWNFVDGNNRTFGAPVGCFDGHGSCASGMIAAIGNNGSGIAGVAHRVRVLPVTSDMNISELSYALSFPQLKAVNHSMSGGFTGGTPAEINALLSTLEPEGVLYVSSLGNLDAFYYGADPAQREPIVAVSNFQSQGYRARFDSSGYGPKTDVAAPAQGVYSTAPRGGTEWFGGTSGASPMTAGVAALLSSQSSTIAPEQVRQLLRMTTRDPAAVTGDNGENTPGWDLYSGWGLVNARGALAELVAGRVPAEANVTSLYKNFRAGPRNDELAVRYGPVPVRAMVGLPASPATAVSWTLRRSSSWDMSGAVVVRTGTATYSTDALLDTVDTDPFDGRQVLELEVTTPGGTVSRERAVIDLPRAYISNLRDGQLMISSTPIGGFGFGPGFTRYRIQVAPGWTPAPADFADVSTSAVEQRPGATTEPGTYLSERPLGVVDPDSLPITVPASGEVTVRVRTEGTRTWTYDAKVVVDNTHPPVRTGFPLATFYSSNSVPTAVDLDGDGTKEILTGGTGTRGVLNAVRADGAAVPSFPVVLPAGEYLFQTFAAGDVDGDGRPEIVLRTSPAEHTGAVRVVRGDGTMVTAGWPVTFDDPGGSFRVLPEQNPPVLADITRDGRLDILVGIDRGTTVTTPSIRVFVHDGTVVRDYGTAADLEGIGAPAVGDLDGDGDPEIVAAAWRRTVPTRSTLYVWRLDGTVAWSADVGPGANRASNPVLLDIDGDRRLEVTTAAGSGPLRVFRTDGTPVSSTTATDNYYRVIAGQLRPSTAAVEMSVLFAAGRTVGGTRFSVVSAIDPASGAERAGWSPAPVFAGSAPFAQPVLADVQGDGALEVLYGNDADAPDIRTVLAAATASGSLIADGQWPIPFPDPIHLTPLVSDLDADGHPELLVETARPAGGVSGRLWVFELPSSTHGGWLPWGEEGHDPRRSSNYHGDLHILSPNTARSEAVGPYDDATLQGALVVRALFSRGAPTGDTTASNWRVTIGTVSAAVREVSRVGAEHWLLVDPVAQPAAGPRMLRVEFDDGGIRTWDAYRDAVVYESPAPVHAVVPVIDDSGSMSTDGKIEAARVAARYFAESAYANDQVGVVAFNSTATDALGGGLRRAGASRGAISGAISGLLAGGSTSIGAGLNLGLDLLGSAPTLRWGMVLLSDGLENTPPYWTRADGVPPVRPRLDTLRITHPELYVNTIALGPDADHPILQDIASSTGGDFYPVALGHSVSMVNRLADVYHFGRERIDRTLRLFSHADTVARRASWNDAVLVPPRARRLQFAFNWDRDLNLTKPEEALRLLEIEIRTPGGSLVRPGSAGVQFTAGRTDAVFTIAAPAPGRWRARLRNRTGGDVEILLAVSAYVPFRLVESWTDLGVVGTAPAARLVAAVTEPRGWVRGATLLATLTGPDETAVDLKLLDDGRSGDGGANDGIFAVTVPFELPGSYLLSLTARGVASDGSQVAVTRAFGRYNARGTDADADGLPDSWERQHSPCGDLDPRGDPDHDGVTNEVEYRAGSDPWRADRGRGPAPK